MNQSSGSCDLAPIRREALDEVVLSELASRLFDRQRFADILRYLLDRSEDVNKRRRKDLALAKAELTKAGKAITNLLVMIESGAMLADDPLFVERMAHNKARMRALETDVLRLERQLSTSMIRITEEMIAFFADKMAHALRD